MAAEDFTTYTEVDTTGVLTVTASKITVVDCDRDIDAYVYKDFGADYFNALNVSFEIYTDSLSATQGFGGGPAFTVSAVDDYSGFGFWDIYAGTYKASGSWSIYLRRGVLQAQDSYVISTNTLYYCTLTRTADSDTVTLDIYSDSDRTNLLDTLTVSGYGTTRKYRYCYGFASYNSALTGRDWDGYVQNVNLSPPPPFIPKVFIL